MAAYVLTTPTSDPTLETNTTDVLATPRGLLAKLASGQWLPANAEEIVAALQLLAVELQQLEGSEIVSPTGAAPVGSVWATS